MAGERLNYFSRAKDLFVDIGFDDVTLDGIVVFGLFGCLGFSFSLLLLFVLIQFLDESISPIGDDRDPEIFVFVSLDDHDHPETYAADRYDQGKQGADDGEDVETQSQDYDSCGEDGGLGCIETDVSILFAQLENESAGDECAEVADDGDQALSEARSSSF